MNNEDIYGLISGILVVASIIPYAIRVLQGKIKPNVTSWTLWSVIGLALLLTYRSSGAEANVWPAIFGFFNPTLIMILAIIKRGEITRPTKLEFACIGICIVSLALWNFLRLDKELVQYALYVGIIADACAAIPTISFVRNHPDEDRPFAWGLYAIGYILAILAIKEPLPANYVLPVYMFFGSGIIAAILLRYRIKKRIPLAQWM